MKWFYLHERYLTPYFQIWLLRSTSIYIILSKCIILMFNNNSLFFTIFTFMLKNFSWLNLGRKRPQKFYVLSHPMYILTDVAVFQIAAYVRSYKHCGLLHVSLLSDIRHISDIMINSICFNILFDVWKRTKLLRKISKMIFISTLMTYFTIYAHLYTDINMLYIYL